MAPRGTYIICSIGQGAQTAIIISSGPGSTSSAAGILRGPGGRAERDASGIRRSSPSAVFTDVYAVSVSVSVSVSVPVSGLPAGRRGDSDPDAWPRADATAAGPFLAALEVLYEQGGLGVMRGAGHLPSSSSASSALFAVPVPVPRPRRTTAGGDGDGAAIFGDGVGRLVSPAGEISGKVGGSARGAGDCGIEDGLCWGREDGSAGVDAHGSSLSLSFSGLLFSSAGHYHSQVDGRQRGIALYISRKAQGFLFFFYFIFFCFVVGVGVGGWFCLSVYGVKKHKTTTTKKELFLLTSKSEERKKKKKKGLLYPWEISNSLAGPSSFLVRRE